MKPYFCWNSRGMTNQTVAKAMATTQRTKSLVYWRIGRRVANHMSGKSSTANEALALMPPINRTAIPERAAAPPGVSSPSEARIRGTMTHGRKTTGITYDVSWAWARMSGESA